MDFSEAQQLFKFASRLLMYPSEEWRQELATFVEMIESVQHRQIQDHLRQFIEWVTAQAEEELLDHYVSTFDFGKKTNLYITYIRHGETRDRGAELLALKQLYARAGFAMTDKELPDYLPLMLEFASCGPEKEVKKMLKDYSAEIGVLREQLVQVQSLYTLILDAVMIAMEEIGIERPVESGVVR
ncbi:nitrate reductase delta subunit [Caldalkalibacillus uzonensis]|uniref:Nitrate reductase delta subunit n=1 Tax=Caldalkalibacillus uzonensis TaxID=353224 RepID=A0ABU0CRN8_9BACI|nr:nitrate reductase molybdenum cofactor assembly chaperone [Caldalkalibacillus uzonensis]MDQ0339085.1 nitrate reductase delta subunit [Caldalkalibacillus uzonensis]